VKCIIQVPCYNEAPWLKVCLDALPRVLEGVARVELLVIDDGSTDGTAEVARACGVNHVVRLPSHLGLARAFEAGLEECLRLGANIIVNTDADNQYAASDIPQLIRPIVDGTAEYVIGERAIDAIRSFSPAKRALQRLGSAVVRRLSRTRIVDAPSGFRALSRRAAQRLQVFTEFTYTHETIIQAGRQGFAITTVPVRTNPDVRPSRLALSTGSYVLKSLLALLRTYAIYRPFRLFSTIGAVLFAGGFLVGLRFLLLYAIGRGTGHLQSLVLCSILLVLGGLLLVVAILADLIAVNRQLLEKMNFRLRALEDAQRSGAAGMS